MNKTELFKNAIEEELEKVLPVTKRLQNDVVLAMRYAVLGGGKRIRSLLLLYFYELFGGDYKDALPFACALEMIHAFSLVHDDMPCMDDDDMRRGKPACHIAFGEDIALLAGDALLNQAFETATECAVKLPAENVLLAIKSLAKATGVYGMIGGQVIDLQSEGKQVSAETLLKIHNGKTAALLTAPAHIAADLLSLDFDRRAKIVNYCENLGMAFQIVDDLLDVIGVTKKLGKKTGSDINKNKTTFVTIHGIEKSKELASEYTKKAIESLSDFNEAADPLRELAKNLVNREF